MKTIFTFQATFLISIFILLTGCYEDSIITPIDEEVVVQTPEVIVNTIITGKVIDENNTIQTNYTLSINSKEYFVEKEFFFLELDQVKKKGQTIYVKQEGETKGFATILLKENDINKITITLFKDIASQQSPLSTITLDEHILCNFQDAAFINNDLREDELSHVDYLTFSHPNISPVGYTRKGDIQGIVVLGGFYINFFNDQGAVLEGAGKDIQFSFSNLPTEAIGLFRFDEEDEHWIYVGDLSDAEPTINYHQGGYFVYAWHEDGVFGEGRLMYEDEILPYALLELEWSSQLTSTTTTTANGNWVAVVKENDVQNAFVANYCGDLKAIESFNTTAMDLDYYATVATDVPYSYLGTTVVDCEGNMLEDVTALTITQSDITEQLYLPEGGSNFYLPFCGNGSIETENSASLPFQDQDTIHNGYLVDCEAYNEGFSFIEIDNARKVYPNFTISTEQNRTVLSAMDGSFAIYIRGNEIGEYETEDINIVIDDPEFGDSGYYIQCKNSPFGCGISKCKITHDGNNEEGIFRVVFSGNVWMQSLTPAVADNYDVEGEIILNI